MFSRLSRNTAILLLNNLFTVGLAFGLTILIGRGFADVGLGRYAAVMAWIAPLSQLADWGLNTLITREVAKNRGATLAYLEQTLGIRWMLGGLLVILVWLAAPYLSSDTTIQNGLRLCALMILIDSIFGVYTAIWRAWEVMWPILVLNLGLLLLQVVGVALVMWHDGALLWVFVVIVGADILQLLATWGLWRWRFQPQARELMPLFTSDKKARLTYNALLKQALPFALAGFLAMLQLRMMFLLLENLSNPQVVGWFAAANRFTEAARTPIFALFGALFPFMAALGGEANRERLKNIFKRTSFGLAGYGLSLAILSSIGGAALIRLAFGAGFAQSAPILIWLSWALIPALLRQNAIILQYTLGHERGVNFFLLLALPLQLGLGLWLIPRHGGIGAALSLLISESALALLMLIWTVKSLSSQAADIGWRAAKP